jgi:SlyX protein
MHDERIIELEIKLAYQDDLLQELNTIVAAQQRQIDQLEAALKWLHARMQSLSEERANPNNAIEIPPHY